MKYVFNESKFSRYFFAVVTDQQVSGGNFWPVCYCNSVFAISITLDSIIANAIFDRFGKPCGTNVYLLKIAYQVYGLVTKSSFSW